MGSSYSYNTRDEKKLNGIRQIHKKEINKTFFGNLTMTYKLEGNAGERQIIVIKSGKDRFRFVHTCDTQKEKIDIVYSKGELINLLKKSEHLQFMVTYLETMDK